MSARVPLNVLDLVSVSEGHSLDQALDASIASAKLADALGYKRFWYAEHHNTPLLGASATALLIARAAERTQRIRLGSGGIMLPNHAPLMVAEEFGTLARFFPGRIDLGIGRAPGTDGLTASLLGRSGSDSQSISRSILDLTGWFGDDGMGKSAPVSAGVAAGTHVPMWILGSSVEGASIAGQLGLPLAVASHFAPDDVEQVLRVYRSSFNPNAPTAQIERPYVMAGINVVLAPTDAEAQRQWTTAQRMIIGVRSGNRQALQPPTDPTQLSPAQHAFADSFLRIKAVGSPETAVRQLQAFVDETGADELITVTYTYDPADRQQSLRLLAKAWFPHSQDSQETFA
ncbi:LLM class flavin-dependent oxidoreductase [Pseudomonas capeferrum]|uniref:LLM class flavin-dependent oxidoreductase n=1 Tax=Pseudomonas capeferrum TaxID=1495066 RepID=UPI0015E2B237|nr:LLM class flavin-dependent oxidoreductase [Pseudomonas capeferrum]MBA1204399.1 LLM class flavin-dependent oxidoreductase [Pseudomonas capeferrum]